MQEDSADCAFCCYIFSFGRPPSLFPEGVPRLSGLTGKA